MKKIIHFKYMNMNIALRRFLHNHDNIASERSPKPGLCRSLISNEFTSRTVLY